MFLAFYVAEKIEFVKRFSIYELGFIIVRILVYEQESEFIIIGF